MNQPVSLYQHPALSDYGFSTVCRITETPPTYTFQVPRLPLLRAHFPDNPLVPGALLLLWAEAFARESFPELGEITALGNVKFLTPVRPEDLVTVTLHRTGGQIQFMFTRESQQLAHGRFIFAKQAAQ